MLIAGRALGPTGGHSDARRRTDVHSGACKCCNAMSFCLEVVDGAEAVRAAVREQLRQGVDQIKIMVSGRLAGAEMARREWQMEGRVPRSTLRSNAPSLCSSIPRHRANAAFRSAWATTP